jgi:hypothetical protein
VQAQVYIVDWNNTSSNYMVDVLSSRFLHIGSLQMLLTIMLAVMIVGPAMGMMAIAGKLHGRISIFNCLALTAVWGQSMASGFINYHIPSRSRSGCSLSIMRFCATKAASS